MEFFHCWSGCALFINSSEGAHDEWVSEVRASEWVNAGGGLQEDFSVHWIVIIFPAYIAVLLLLLLQLHRRRSIVHINLNPPPPYLASAWNYLNQFAVARFFFRYWNIGIAKGLFRWVIARQVCNIHHENAIISFCLPHHLWIFPSCTIFLLIVFTLRIAFACQKKKLL
jgi:hypothetical protein